MPESVAENQMADPQPLRLGRHPSGNGHCLPNGFIGQPRRLEVIDERYSVEAAGLGMARALGDVGHR